MKRLRNILLLLFISINSFGTSQFGDILIWNGDTLALFSNPLESYPEIGKLKQIIEKQLEKQDRLVNPEKYKSDEYQALWSTACYRGYIAEWIVIGNGIYLNNIYSCHDDKVKVNLTEVFPDKIVNNKIKAVWLTEDLFIPQGDCLAYSNFEYNSIYETETALTVEKGEIINIKKYKNSVKESSVNTNEIIYKNLDWKTFPEIENEIIQVVVTVQPTETGKFERIVDYYTLNDESQQLEKENKYSKEALRLVKLIPEFNVYVRRDKVIELDIFVFFDKMHRN